MPSMPEVLTLWRISTASNQPQRRRPAGVGAEFVAAIADRLADVVIELGRKRTAADARRIGLGDAQDIADRAWPKAGAGRRIGGDRIGRGHEGVGAVIDVEQRALRALEQNALAGAARRGRAGPRSRP